MVRSGDLGRGKAVLKVFRMSCWSSRGRDGVVFEGAEGGGLDVGLEAL